MTSAASNSGSLAVNLLGERIVQDQVRIQYDALINKYWFFLTTAGAPVFGPEFFTDKVFQRVPVTIERTRFIGFTPPLWKLSVPGKRALAVLQMIQSQALKSGAVPAGLAAYLRQ